MIKSINMVPRRKLTIVIFLLGLAALFQCLNLAIHSIRDLGAIWRDKGQSAIWRGARFSQGYRFAGFVQFLISNIPENGLVILPPGEDAPRMLSTTPFMQFFLLPRKVVNCTNYECYQRLYPVHPYILLVSKAQEAALPEIEGIRMMVDQNWGLLIPKDALLLPSKPPRGVNSILGLIWATVFPTIWLGLVVSSGYLLIGKLFPDWERIDRFAFGYGVSLGAISILAAVLSLLGAPLTNLVFWVLTGLWVSVAAGLGIFRRKLLLEENTREMDYRASLNDTVWLGLFLGLALVAGVISMGKGYHTTDAIQTWGVKGYAIAVEASIQNVAAWGTNPWAYPLHIPLLIAIFKSLFDETLPASKIIFSGYFLCFLVAIYRFLLLQTREVKLAGLLTLLIATSPMIFNHATIAYANLAFTFYLILGTLLFTRSLELTSQGHTDRHAFLGGIFFALAAWTRPEGLALAFVGIGLLAGLDYLFKKRIPIRCFILTLAPLLLYLFFWELVKSSVYSHPATNANMLAGTFEKVLSSGLPVEEAGFLFRKFFSYVFDLERWGVMGLGGSLLLIWQLTTFKPWRHASIRIFVYGLFIIVAVLGAYYLTSYAVDSRYDLSRWISTGMDRALMPGLLLVWLALGGELRYRT